MAALASACGSHDGVAPGSRDAGAGGEDTFALPPPSWTLVALPDPQGLTVSYPEVFAMQTSWIAANAESRRIHHVVTEGDITNDATDTQWGVADRCFRLLDGKVPYAMGLGNHDYPGSGQPERRDTRGFDAAFPRDRIATQPTFLESFDGGTASNSAFAFEGHGERWLLLALEFGPRDAVLAWADGVLKRNPTANAIIETHAYLHVDGTRFDHVSGVDQWNNPHEYDSDGRLGGVNDGEEIWQKLVAPNPNVRLVLCGHMHAQARLTSTRDGMLPVHQLLADFQGEELGGSGYLRILTFRSDGTVAVQTYSPFLNKYRADPDNEFELGW